MKRSVLATCFLVALAACSSTPVQKAPRPKGYGTLEVLVDGFESAKGQALVALFLDEEGWPDDGPGAHEGQKVPIRDGRVRVLFDTVPAGEFAVAVFHDENKDYALDTGWFGIPTEDYGFSNDARSMFGPPDFEDAVLFLKPNEQKSIQIRVD